MGWLEFESFRFFCPDGADVFEGVGLEPSSEVVSVDEVDEALPEVLVGFVVEALDGSFHAFDLAVGPGMFRFGQALVNIGLCAGELEGMGAEQLSPPQSELDLRSGRAAVAGRGAMHSVVGEHGVHLVGHGLDQRVEEVGRPPLSGLLMDLSEGEFRGPVDGDEEVKLALLGAHLRDIDVKVDDRVGLELLAPGRSPSTSGSREMWCRCRQRCSEERVSSGIVACSAYRQSSSGSRVCRRKATRTALPVEGKERWTSVPARSFDPQPRSATSTWRWLFSPAV